MAAATSLVFRVLGVDAGASATIRKVGLEAEAAGGKFDNLGSKLKTFGIGAAAAVIGVGAASVKMAMDFDQSMTRLNTQAGVPLAKIGQLSAGVLDLAGKVGVGPNSLAQSLYHVMSTFQSTGITSAKALDLVRVAAEGAKIGGSDLVDTTNALTAAVASGISGAQNFEQAMGALNATVGSGDMTMQDLTEAINTGFLSVVKAFGVTLPDVSAALATFGDAGIRGADAATGLRMAIQAMAHPAATGKKALDDVGLSTTALAQDMQQGGLNKAMQDLVKHMTDAGITGPKVGQFITDAFGKKSSSSLAVLVEQFARFQSKYKDVSAQSKTFSTDWANQQKQFKQQWDDLSASLQAAGIKLGNWLIPKIQDVIKWFGKHKAATDALKIALGVGLVAALAAATAGMVAFTVSLVTNPIFLIVVAVEALVVGIYELYKHWNQIWHWMGDHKQYAAVILGLGLVVAPIFAIGIAIAMFATHWSDTWKGIQTVFYTAQDGILVGFKALVDGIFWMVESTLQAASHLPYVGHHFKVMENSVKELQGQFDGAFNNMIDKTHQAIASLNAIPPIKRVTFTSDGVPNVVGDIERINTALDKIGSSYVVSVGGTGRKLIPGAATGMLVPGSGSPTADDKLVRVSSGEAIVPAHLVGPIAPFLGAHGVPGFAAGGRIGPTTVSVDTMAIGNSLFSGYGGMFSGGSGGGAARWAGSALQVLAMLGLSAALLPKVLSQINTESGGNPGAINMTDSNARAGHPSMGLMQTIMSTFLTYAGPYAALGPFNGFADLYAGLNYAKARYGPNLNGLGEGHGYAMGGMATGWAKVGEAGTEMVYLGRGGQVLSHRDSAAMGGSTHIHIHGPVYSDSAGIKRLMSDIDREIARSGNNVPATFRR